MTTYPPKIAEDLIPRLRDIAEQEGVPTAEVVDQFLREKVDAYEAKLNIQERAEAIPF